MIYLDNAATTKMYEECADIYKDYACNSFYNPSAEYRASLEIAKKINQVRDLIKQKLGANNGNIIFTSGATESNNLAIMGSKRNGKYEYIFSEGSHPSVYNVANELKRQGYIVHFVGLNADGQVDYERLSLLVNENTRLVSVIHVNNETGAINDLNRISLILKQKSKNALFHVDGVQAFCKIDFKLNDYNIDFYTISAHKIHGPKGVGVLYVKNINNIKPIIFGGGQESGYRSGTENVGGIMAMGKAIEIINVKDNYNKVTELKDVFLHYMQGVEGVKVISGQSPYIISMSFKGVNGETLMRALQDRGVLVGKGSACSSKKSGNRVLESMGISMEEIKTHIRISFSELNTLEEMKEAAKIIVDVYKDIREKVS